MSLSPATPVRVGILDSGLPPQLSGVLARCCFGAVPAELPVLAHGAAVARAIRSLAPEAELLDARIFLQRLTTTVEQVADGLEWLVAEGAQVVNMSFGLRQDRPRLAAAVAAAQARGVVLVASAPAHGEAVYPAAYAGVLRATGDARCDSGDLSWAPSPQAHCGACVRLPDSPPGLAGASIACAHVSGHVARLLAAGVPVSDLQQALARSARFQGPERREDFLLRQGLAIATPAVEGGGS